MKLLKIGAAAMAVMLVSLGGCAPKNEEKTTVESLKVGIMPAVDAAPLFIAESEKYFEELGVKVEIEVFTNAQNRQTALQTGEIDGAITDVIALVNNVNNGFKIKATTGTDGVFPFLTKADLEGKENIKAGMMEISVTNYISDKALSSKYKVEKVYINDIPSRLEMVATGTLDLAVIPEPMASQGELNGLKKLMIPTGDEYSPDVMVFTANALSKKTAAVEKFHKAYNKAVASINKDDSAARTLLIEKLKLNPEIKDKITMPNYQAAVVPSEAFMNAVIKWNNDVLGQSANVKYSDLIDARFAK